MIMNKYLNLVIAVLVIGMSFASCSKNDEGGRAGGFEVGVPGFVKQTTLIPVVLNVDCDVMPTVRFAVSDGALGVVSMTPDVKLGVDYVYPGESVPVTFANGHATATFWYIPLTPGDHGVAFEVNYRQGGEQHSGVNSQSFNVSDAANGGFYPEVATAPGYYFFEFRNELGKNKEGCKIYLRFGDVNGNTDPTSMDMTITQNKIRVAMEADIFYPIKCATWDQGLQNWTGSDIMKILNDQVDPITMKLIFSDDFNRCRDVIVKLDKDRNLISSTAGDYYLMPRNK